MIPVMLSGCVGVLIKGREKLEFSHSYLSSISSDCKFLEGGYTKADVKSCMGEPVKIKIIKDEEYWYYNRKMSFIGILPAVIGILPIPIGFPSWYYDHKLVFKDDMLVNVITYETALVHGAVCFFWNMDDNGPYFDFHCEIS